MFRDIPHSIVCAAEQLCDKIYSHHGVRLLLRLSEYHYRRTAVICQNSAIGYYDRQSRIREQAISVQPTGLQ